MQLFGLVASFGPVCLKTWQPQSSLSHVPDGHALARGRHETEAKATTRAKVAQHAVAPWSDTVATDVKT